MKIGIDARFFSEAGIGRYIRNLINNLEDLDGGNEYYIFLLDKHFNSVSLKKNFTKVRANFGWYGFSEQTKFLKLLNSYRLDLMHFPHFNIPVLYHGKFVVTIHDLIHQKFKMERATTRGPVVYKIKQLGYDFAFSKALKNSKKIITVSDYVKEELEKKWNVKKDKIVVTKEAVEENFLKYSQKLNDKKIMEVLEKYKINSSFIYYIGNAHPHKNVEGLIKSFLILQKKMPELLLVLSGHDHYFWERVKEENKYEGIIYTGYVTDEEAVALLKCAAVYVQPSFEEGFGIPILEAMAVGCPVVSSGAASLPEVGGDAAIYFDPKNIEDAVSKISKVLENKKLQMELIRKGKKRYKEFSWKKMAEETLKVYRDIL